MTRAQILLQAHAGVGDAQIAAALQVDPATVHRPRQRFVEEGLEGALQDRPRPGGRRKLDGNQEAFLVALTCSDPPVGHPHWAMQWRADRLVALKKGDRLAEETVRRTLKKPC